MYYRITSDGTTIYDSRTPLEGFKVVDPTLTFSEDASGKLEFTLPVTNNNYSVPVGIASCIKVYKDDKEIWEGRILSESVDFYKNRKITCEGELGYLNDTLQPNMGYPNSLWPGDPNNDNKITIRDYLTALITNHNANTTQDKYFTVGDVTAVDEDFGTYISTSYQNTLHYVKELAESLKAHIRVEKRNGTRYIDLLAEDYDRQSDQIIHFGRNLIDYTQNWDLSNLATVVYPFGASITGRIYDDTTEYVCLDKIGEVTKEVVNPEDPTDVYILKHPDQAQYVECEKSIQHFGRIETIAQFDEIPEGATNEQLESLMEKGFDYLQNAQFAKLTLECSAVDLSVLGVESDELWIRDYVRVVSPPHGMDRWFTITGVTLKLDNPAGNSYKLGREATVSMSDRTVEANRDIIEDISETNTNLRKDSLASLINCTTGKITLAEFGDGTDAIIIAEHKVTDTLEYDSILEWIENTDLTHFWMWNNRGLAYYDTSKRDGQHSYIDWGNPLSIDWLGRIFANIIVSGEIYGGTYAADGTYWYGITTGVSNGNYPFYIDKDGKIYGSELFITKIFGNRQNDGTYTFSVDEHGNIQGATLMNKNIVTGTIELTGDLDASQGTVTGAIIRGGTPSGGVYPFRIDRNGNIYGATLQNDNTITGTIYVTGGFYAKDSQNNISFGVNARTGGVYANRFKAKTHLQLANEDDTDSVYWATRYIDNGVYAFTGVSGEGAYENLCRLFVRRIDLGSAVYTSGSIAGEIKSGLNNGVINVHGGRIYLEGGTLNCDSGKISNTRWIELENNSATNNVFLTCEVDEIGTEYFAICHNSDLDTYAPVHGGAYSTPSDIRLKDTKNIDASKLIELILSVKPIIYEWKATKDGLNFGFGAQNVEEVINSIEGLEDSRIVTKPIDEDGTYMLAYSEFIAPLVATVQYQEKRINELEERLAKVEELLSRL